MKRKVGGSTSEEKLKRGEAKIGSRLRKFTPPVFVSDRKRAILAGPLTYLDPTPPICELPLRVSPPDPDHPYPEHSFSGLD